MLLEEEDLLRDYLHTLLEYWIDNNWEVFEVISETLEEDAALPRVYGYCGYLCIQATSKEWFDRNLLDWDMLDLVLLVADILEEIGADHGWLRS